MLLFAFSCAALCQRGTQANPQDLANGLAPEQLERGLALTEATALNMTFMVGIGPFVVIPFVVQAMGGPQSLLAWALGALLAAFDGCVWAELGAAMPQAGRKLRLFARGVWGAEVGTVDVVPVYLADAVSGAAEHCVGRAGICGLFGISGAEVGDGSRRLLAPLGGAHGQEHRRMRVLLVVLLLYRRITTIGKISVVLWVIVIGTILWMIYGGVRHHQPGLLFSFPPGAWNLSRLFFLGLGHATVQTVYSYLGYYNVSNLGGGDEGAGEKYSARDFHFDIWGSRCCIWRCRRAC